MFISQLKFNEYIYEIHIFELQNRYFIRRKTIAVKFTTSVAAIKPEKKFRLQRLMNYPH